MCETGFNLKSFFHCLFTLSIPFRLFGSFGWIWWLAQCIHTHLRRVLKSLAMWPFSFLSFALNKYSNANVHTQIQLYTSHINWYKPFYDHFRKQIKYTNKKVVIAIYTWTHWRLEEKDDTRHTRVSSNEINVWTTAILLFRFYRFLSVGVSQRAVWKWQKVVGGKHPKRNRRTMNKKQWPKECWRTLHKYTHSMYYGTMYYWTNWW